MNILFVPFDRFNLDSNEAIPTRIKALSAGNRLMGVERKSAFSEGLPRLNIAGKFLLYSIRVLGYGIRHRREIDLVYCNEWFYALTGVMLSVLTRKPCVRDCASITWEWVGRVRPSLPVRMLISASERIEKRFVSMHIVLSEADREAYLQHGYDPRKVTAIPRPADLSLADRVSGEKPELRRVLRLEPGKKLLLFSGKLDYPPNTSAAEWINKELAPALAARFNNVEILITGRGRKPGAIHPGVNFTGYVPDLFEYLHASDVFVAPVEMPSGRLTKVFDALSCRLPAVVLTSATNGTPELADGKNAMIARSRAEFIEKTIHLLENPEKARQIGIRGRKMLEEHYDWIYWREQLDRTLKSLLKRKT